MGRHMNGETDEWGDRQMWRQTNGETDKWGDRQIGDRQMDRPMKK